MPERFSEMTSERLFQILGEAERPNGDRGAARYELASRGALEPEPCAEVPHQAPELHIPARQPPVQTNGSSAWGCFLLPAMIAGWLFYALAYAPHHALKSQVLPNDCTLWTELALAFPSSYPRIEQLQAQNLDIYILRKDFESVPYPDRPAVSKSIGKTWEGYTHWYNFSSVRIRDIQTGRVMASYSCNTGGVDLTSDGWF